MGNRGHGIGRAEDAVQRLRVEGASERPPVSGDVRLQTGAAPRVGEVAGGGIRDRRRDTRVRRCAVQHPLERRPSVGAEGCVEQGERVVGRRRGEGLDDRTGPRRRGLRLADGASHRLGRGEHAVVPEDAYAQSGRGCCDDGRSTPFGSPGVEGPKGDLDVGGVAGEDAGLVRDPREAGEQPLVECPRQ